MCQYSYSAACSRHCLQARRFCRYGLEAAIIRRGEWIKGSCPGHDDKESTIDAFRGIFKTDSLDLRDPCPAPSWSWVSAGTGVKYWPNIRHVRWPPEAPRAFSSPCEIDDAKVFHSGGSIAGPVTGAWLRLNGYMACPRLRYRYEPVPD